MQLGFSFGDSFLEHYKQCGENIYFKSAEVVQTSQVVTKIVTNVT